MILKGSEIKASKVEELKIQVNQLNEKLKLVIIVVGEDYGSSIYVRNKRRFAQEVGIDCEVIEMNTDISETHLINTIETLNEDDQTTGILVQLPLPNHIDEFAVINTISDQKDVDGFHLINNGKLLVGMDATYPCTVEAIIEFINYANIDVSGKNVVVVGRSNIVGKPLAVRLINLGATVTVCNSKTKNIKTFIDSADIFISAIGVPKFFTQDYFTDNDQLTVIDVGINRVDGKLCGDVDYENVCEHVKNITPVPGGVGVLTVVKVLENLIKLKKIQIEEN